MNPGIWFLITQINRPLGKGGAPVEDPDEFMRGILCFLSGLILAFVTFYFVCTVLNLARGYRALWMDCAVGGIGIAALCMIWLCVRKRLP